MSVFYIILLIFLYLAVGAIIGGVMDFGNDISIGILFWPVFVAAMIIYYIFWPFIKFGGWIGEKYRRYRYKRQMLKKKGIGW